MREPRTSQRRSSNPPLADPLARAHRAAPTATSSPAPQPKPDRRPAGGAKRRSWKPASTASTTGHSGNRRDERYQLREALEPLRTADRLRSCGRGVIQGGATVTLAEGGRAHFSGLETCGSVWACPVCAPKVRAVRAGELERFAVGWIGAGRGLAMATFTIRHHRHERLSDQVAGLASAWRRMVAGRPWRRLREDFKLHGYTKAEEITHGENGWHPHFHVLLWSKAPLNKERADRLNDQLHALWYTACEREGLGLPTRAHGVQVDPVRRGKDGARDIARYVAKVQDGAGVERAMGNEMIRGDLKSGRKDSRTPFEVARDFTRTGDIADLERWQEYERATRGRKALTWSRGLKAELAALLELQADDRDDQAIAAEQIGGEQLATVPRAVWYRHVVAVPGRRLALLRAAEALGQVGVRVLIESWELEWGRDVLIPPAPVQTRAA